MLHRLRFALSPGWLVLHLVTLGMVVAMVLLGRWQLMVSNAKHFDLQNFGYALQWWAFSLFALAMWARIMRDTRDRVPAGHVASLSGADSERPELAPVAYRRYVMPQSSDAPAPAADSQHAAYNDYLARLDADTGKAPAGAEGSAP